jgi:hypothetical protein
VQWRAGTVEMAKLFAASANVAHGLRRTAGDRRRAIEMVLSTAEGARWTQEEIAKHCKVARSWVAAVMAKRRTDNPPKKTATCQAHEGGAEARTHRRCSSSKPDRAIARQLGVDRETVAAVRATAETSAAASANDAAAPRRRVRPARRPAGTRPSACEPRRAPRWSRCAWCARR